MAPGSAGTSLRQHTLQQPRTATHFVAWNMHAERVIVLERVAYDIYRVRGCGSAAPRVWDVFAPHDLVEPMMYSYELVAAGNRLVDPRPLPWSAELHSFICGETWPADAPAPEDLFETYSAIFSGKIPAHVREWLQCPIHRLASAVPMRKAAAAKLSHLSKLAPAPIGGARDWRALVRETGGLLRLPELWCALHAERTEVLSSEEAAGRLSALEALHRDVYAEAVVLHKVAVLTQEHRRVWLNANQYISITSQQLIEPMRALVAADIIRTRQTEPSAPPELALTWAVEQLDAFLEAAKRTGLRARRVDVQFPAGERYDALPPELFRRSGVSEVVDALGVRGEGGLQPRKPKRHKQDLGATSGVLLVCPDLAVDDWVERKLVTTSMAVAEMPLDAIESAPSEEGRLPIYRGCRSVVRLQCTSERSAVRRLRSGEFGPHMQRPLFISPSGFEALEHAANSRLAGALGSNGALPEHCYRVRFTSRVRVGRATVLGVKEPLDLLCVPGDGVVTKYAVVHPSEKAHLRIPASVVHAHTTPANRVSYRNSLSVPRGGYSCVAIVLQPGAGERWLFEAARIADGAPLYIISL